MAIYTFSSVLGTTILFDPLNDTLVFAAGVNAADLRLSQSGADTLVTLNGSSVRLATINVSGLVDSNFSFADGSVVRIGSAADQTLNGSAGADYFDISTGGADTVSAGIGNDVIIAGSQLGASDQIDGGVGLDTLRLSGNLSVLMGANTVTAVETLSVGEGTATIALANSTVTSANGAFVVDASSQGQGSAINLDGSAVTSTAFTVLGGSGNDYLIGGGGNNSISGADGADTLEGGGGATFFSAGSVRIRWWAARATTFSSSFSLRDYAPKAHRIFPITWTSRELARWGATSSICLHSI